MKIAIAADHAGYVEKEQLKPLLNDLGIDFEDLGTSNQLSRLIILTTHRKWPTKLPAVTSIKACSSADPGRAWRSQPTKFRACAPRLRGTKTSCD